MARWDDGSRWDSGARYDDPGSGGPKKKRTMASNALPSRLDKLIALAKLMKTGIHDLEVTINIKLGRSRSKPATVLFYHFGYGPDEMRAHNVPK